MEIQIEKSKKEQEVFFYKMKSTNPEFKDVKIKVLAEDGGHRCLFGIILPRMSIKGMCWSGSTKFPLMEDVFFVLNHILRKYNCSERVVTKRKGK